MAETQAKYHHLVPQTYMSAWAHGNGTLNVEFLDSPGNIVERNKEKIAGITDFHSIKAGMHAFDNWNIKRVDGSLVSKKNIKREIEKIKIKDVEANWSTKYENNWALVVAKIEAAVLLAPNGSIPVFDKRYLMKFFTALDWRGFRSNQHFEESYRALTCGLLDDLEIPEDERILPSLKTAADEMRHDLLLQFYRKYLNDTGVIFEDAMANLQHTNFHFLIADGLTKFITSDSPAFIHRRDDEKLVGLLPITPRILMAKGKCIDDDDLYYVTHITDEAVKRYNDAIRSNAEEFVIHQRVVDLFPRT